MMSACKRARYDSDGDAIMTTMEEYMECPEAPNEHVLDPAEPSDACADTSSNIGIEIKGEPELTLSPIGLVNPIRSRVFFLWLLQGGGRFCPPL